MATKKYMLTYEYCFLTPKKKRIYIPTDLAKQKGYQIIRLLKSKWLPPDFYFHLKKGGHVAAVKHHKDSKWYAKLDMKSFFPNISRAKVRRSLKLAGFNDSRAKDIAEWSTVKCKDITGIYILPYGFVQSPYIASICLDRSVLGKFLHTIAKEQINLSVYVDDIIISSDDLNALEAVYKDLRLNCKKAGFQINEDKAHSPKAITIAFNIELNETSCSIENNRFAEFEKAIDKNNMKRSEAIINYVSAISRRQAEELEKLL